MANNTVNAEYDSLESVRVLKPGFETFLGNLDPDANLFYEAFSIGKAQEEHRQMVEVLEAEGVEVRQLHEDITQDSMEDLIDQFGSIDVSDLDENPEEVRGDIRDNWSALDPWSQLQLIMSRPTVERHPSENKDLSRNLSNSREDSVTITMEQPTTNMIYQRDQQIVGDKGPIMCEMYYGTRQTEADIVEEAWGDIGADLSSPVSSGESIEGGEFIPAGDFALMGVESVQGDVLRTTYGAAEDILESGQLGYDEVGLVKAPKAKAEEMADENEEVDMDIMHLDTWFNIAADGLAVMNEELAEYTEVDVFQRDNGEYSFSHTADFDDYLEQQGYDWIDIPKDELPEAANFLTLEDGKVLAVYNTPDNDEAGEYDPELNQTIEEMKSRGVEVVPDGTGLDLENLTDGYGGAHCMTTPINRE